MNSDSTAKGACEHCEGHLEFPLELAGQSIDCPHCGKSTKLSIPTGSDGARAKEALKEGFSHLAKAASMAARETSARARELGSSEAMQSLKEKSSQATADLKHRAADVSRKLASQSGFLVRWKRPLLGTAAVLLVLFLARYQPWKSGFERDLMWAKRGDAQAQYELAARYSNGDGVESDQALALEWGEKAAEGGSVDAQVVLAMNYAFGHGVRQDYQRAHELLSLAADQGDHEAYAFLGELHYRGMGCRQSYQEALKWFEKSDDHAISQYFLGIMYYEATGVKKDADKALLWLGRASDQEYSPATVILGRIHATDSGGLKNPKKALKYFNQAIDMGDPDGKCYLGFCQVDGVGMKKDYRKGLAMIEEAAREGSQDAENWLRKARQQDFLSLLGAVVNFGFDGGGSSGGGGFDAGVQMYYDQQWQKYQRR